MSKSQIPAGGRERKPLVWLAGGTLKSPPFTAQGRQEAGMLLRFLQEGEQLGMPQAEPLPDIGPRCGALRVRDAAQNWRILYRVDADVVLVIDVFSKKSRKLPHEVIDRCRQRLKQYDEVMSRMQKSRPKDKPRED